MRGNICYEIERTTAKKLKLSAAYPNDCLADAAVKTEEGVVEVLFLWVVLAVDS